MWDLVGFSLRDTYCHRSISSEKLALSRGVSSRLKKYSNYAELNADCYNTLVYLFLLGILFEGVDRAFALSPPCTVACCSPYPILDELSLGLHQYFTWEIFRTNLTIISLFIIYFSIMIIHCSNRQCLLPKNYSNLCSGPEIRKIVFHLEINLCVPVTQNLIGGSQAAANVNISWIDVRPKLLTTGHSRRVMNGETWTVSEQTKHYFCNSPLLKYMQQKLLLHFGD